MSQVSDNEPSNVLAYIGQSDISNIPNVPSQELAKPVPRSTSVPGKPAEDDSGDSSNSSSSSSDSGSSSSSSSESEDDDSSGGSSSSSSSSSREASPERSSKGRSKSPVSRRKDRSKSPSPSRERTRKQRRSRSRSRSRERQRARGRGRSPPRHREGRGAQVEPTRRSGGNPPRSSKGAITQSVGDTKKELENKGFERVSASDSKGFETVGLKKEVLDAVCVLLRSNDTPVTMTGLQSALMPLLVRTPLKDVVVHAISRSGKTTGNRTLSACAALEFCSDKGNCAFRLLHCRGQCR